MDVLRSLCMALVSAAAVACSGSEAPTANKPVTPATPPKSTPDQPAPKDATPVAAPVEDCVEPVAAEAITSVMRTWALVGTSVEPVFLGSIGELVFVATGARMYDAAAGEPMVASTSNAAGLPRKPGVVSVFGAWPEDAWLVTLKGPHPDGGDGQEFELWRWQSDRWSRQNKKELFGEGLAEVYKWTEGRVLALDCSARPRLGFESYGAEGPLPPRLSRVGGSSSCPEKFFALPAGDVFAIDDLSRANHLMIHWCPSCGDPAVEEILPLRLCGAPPTVSLRSIKVPVAPRDAILSLHAHAQESGFSGSFLVRREEKTWVGEAVPGGQSVDTMAVGTDGAIWLATDVLLRREPKKGKWERHGLPSEDTGDIAQIVVVRDDEVWIVVKEATTAGAGMWSVYRTGTEKGSALNLDSGKPLPPNKTPR